MDELENTIAIANRPRPWNKGKLTKPLLALNILVDSNESPD
jgi:hypothetical protein